MKKYQKHAAIGIAMLGSLLAAEGYCKQSANDISSKTIGIEKIERNIFEKKNSIENIVCCLDQISSSVVEKTNQDLGDANNSSWKEFYQENNGSNKETRELRYVLSKGEDYYITKMTYNGKWYGISISDAKFKPIANFIDFNGKGIFKKIDKNTQKVNLKWLEE